MSSLENALALANMGLHVFPITKNQKRPPRFKGWAEKATVDPGLIEKWWSKWPHDNVGVSAGPSGLLILDVDTKKDVDGMVSLAGLELEHGDLPDTLEATSPSGSKHLYFHASFPAKTTTNELGDGLDVRGHGGYVLGHGSRADDGDYTWTDPSVPIATAPAWLEELNGEAGSREPGETDAVIELDHEDDLSRAAEWLKSEASASIEGEGGNTNMYKVSCRVRDLGASEEACIGLMLGPWNERCEPPWDEEELRKTVGSAYQNATSAAGTDSPHADFDELPEDPAADAAAKKRKEGPFPDWTWVVGVKRFVPMDRPLEMFDREQFDTMYNHRLEKGTSMASYLFRTNGIRKALALSYRPGKDQLPRDGTLNVWTPSDIVPTPGDISWFTDHLKWLVPDDRERGLILDYLAHIVQRPGEKIHFALLMQGLPGSGKSFIGRLMERIVGGQNVSRPSNEELHDRYTEWQKAKQLVVVEELMSLGRREVANKLKPSITDETCRIREMYVPPYTIENCLTYLIFTNYRDSIPIEKKDRRYFVVFSPADPADRPANYYEKLFEQSKGDGAAHLAHHLLKRDISDFDAKGHAPDTLAKEEMRRESLPEIELSLLEMHEAGEGPFACDLTTALDVEAAVPDRMSRMPRLKAYVRHLMRDVLGAEELGQHRLPNSGRRVKLWVISRRDMWLNETPKTRAKHYEKFLTGQIADDFVDDEQQTEET